MTAMRHGNGNAAAMHAALNIKKRGEIYATDRSVARFGPGIAGRPGKIKSASAPAAASWGQRHRRAARLTLVSTGLASRLGKAGRRAGRSARRTVMTLVDIIIWLIIGGIAGWLAGLIVEGFGFGLIGNIVVGIIGALIAGWLLPRLGIIIGGGIIAAIINAVIGAVILLVIVGFVRKATA
jgi:uncharacterized membrane protein YeaQ/YmgE (transglycosylase-associated protein family)